eukprot:EG_transcript_10059
MVITTLFHLGPHVDVAIFAHPSWAPHNRKTNATRFMLLDEDTFYDMQAAPRGAERPSVASQSAANKLRIYRLLPAVAEYDVVVMLDCDIMVQANFLRLMGTICRDTLYTASHQQPPEINRSVPYFQSRNATPEEHAYMMAHNPFVFNSGQFLFRPSPLMERLFGESYESYKRDPQATLYEQGHMATVFMLACRVRYTMTHLLLLGLKPAREEPPPAAFALLHFCDWYEPASRKVAGMRHHLPTAFRPLSVVRSSMVKRLVSALKEANSENAVFSHAPIDDSQLLSAAYTRMVTQPNITQMCEVGYHGGFNAAIALTANPTARLTIFNPAVTRPLKPRRGVRPEFLSQKTLGILAYRFPTQLTEMQGPLKAALRNYTRLVGLGKQRPCDTILLPPVGTGLGKLLKSVRSIMARPVSYALVASVRPFPASLRLPAGTASALNCWTVAEPPSRAGRWCVW